jgi:glycosyltransferase involved in cell wall biosynthesis/4-amino-4-deoxy-L-arabinose transferase-like glycosyltransferase
MVYDACLTKTMRILIASGIYPPEGGGPSIYSHAMARALVSMGHSVSVVAYGEESSSTSDGWRVERVSRRGGAVVRYLRYFVRAWKAMKSVDVVYLQGAVSEGLPTTIAAGLRRVPTVYRIPGDYAWEMSQQKGDTDLLDAFLEKRHRGVIGLYERIERFVAKRASRIIAPSNYLKSVAIRWGIASPFITVIRNAEDSLPPGLSREQKRQAENMDGRTVCFTVVRAVPWKGVAELIEWWNGLPDTHQLVMAGDGPELEKWKMLAEKSPAAKRIRFVGRLNREEIGNWMRASDVFLLHSGYEGYPHVVAEAASMGVPCLVSDQGGNPETKEVFGDLIRVLPYRNQQAWVQALKDVSVRKKEEAPVSTWSHRAMSERVEGVLIEAERKEGPMQTLMFSFDRSLLDTESASMQRIQNLAGEGMVQAVVLSSFKTDEIAQVDHVTAYGFSGSGFMRFLRSILQGIRIVRGAPKRTLVTAQDPFIAGVIGYLVSRIKNVPLEVQEHGDFYSGYWKKESWKNRCLSFVGKFVLGQAERVRVVSDRVKEHLIAIGIEAEKIEVIPVAVVVETLHATRYTPHPTGSEFRFVVPCRFVEQKGLDVLLEAASLLKKEHAPFHLSIIGRGPLLSALHGMIESKGLVKEVDIQDWKEGNDVWKDADGFVMSSRYEGFGRTVLEAMASKVAVVATDVGCVGSVLRPGVDGRVVAIGDTQGLADAMKAVIVEKESTERMIASAYERAESFSSTSTLHEKQRAGWRLMLNQVLDVRPRFDLWVLAFVLFALATRLASAFLFHKGLVNREWGFYTLVEHWFQGYGYSYATELGCPSAYRSPGFLFFLTALYSVIRPENTLAQALIQNLIAWLALILVYVVGKRFVGKKAALLGGLMMACYPYTFYHFTQYYHTFLSTFFILFLVWTLLRLKENKKLSTAVLAGVSIGALAYIQGTILPAAPFIVVWLLWMWWPDWKRTVLVAAIMAVVSAGMIAPWTYRNWKAFHAFVPLTTDLGHGFYKANNEYIYEITKRGYPMEIVDDPVVSSTNPNYIMFTIQPWLREELEKDGAYRDSIYWTEWHPKYPVGKMESCSERGLMDEKQFADYWAGRSKEWMTEHFWTDAWKLPLQKFKTFWQPGLFPSVKTGAPWSFANNPTKVFLARFAVWFSTLVVVWFGLAGLVIAVRRKKKEAVLVVILALVYSIMHSLFAGYTKYRMPLDHLLAPFAAYTLFVLYETRIRRK